MIAAGSAPARRRSLAQESAVIGTVQAAGFALGFLFLSLYGGVLESLETLLFGSFLGITTRPGLDARSSSRSPRCVFFAVAGRPLLYSSVDEAVAGARGVPVRAAPRRVPARARARRRRDRADHRRAARVRAARRARRGRAAAHPPDRRSGSFSPSLIALAITWVGLGARLLHQPLGRLLRDHPRVRHLRPRRGGDRPSAGRTPLTRWRAARR